MSAAAITMDEFLALVPEPAWTPDAVERFGEEQGGVTVLVRRLHKPTRQGLDPSLIFASRVDITLH